MTDKTAIGANAPRLEDQRLLTGHGRFVEDIGFEGMLHAAMVRAPVAHARIASIDVSAAAALPGVAGVLTGQDLVKAGLRPLPCVTPQESSDGAPFRAPERMALPVETVRFVGEAVAMVVAETEALAREAAELVEVDYDDLPATMSTAEAAEIAFDFDFGDPEAVERAFARAAHRVSIENLVNNRIVIAPLETRSAIGLWDAAPDRYTLYTQSQGVHFMRDTVLKTLEPGLEKDQLRVVTPDVGGSFAVKLANYPEHTLVLHAAKRFNRPVRWVESRSESFLSDTQGRDHVSSAEAAFDADGRILGLRIETRGSLGAYASALSPSIIGKGFAKVAGHNYDIGALHVRTIGVYTNNAPTEAFRGAGKPEVIYLVERLIEKAARELDLDRVDLRRRNLIPANAMPYAAANGFTYDSGDFPAAFERALEASDWAGFPDRRKQSEARGKRRGIGVCPYLHLTGGTPNETSSVILRGDGTILVKTGVQASGQGHETTFAQLLSSRLAVPMDRIRVLEGDSAEIVRGGGTGGSSSLPIAATTIARAADLMIEEAKRHAADRLEAAIGDIAYGDGAFTIVGTDRRVGLFDLARELDDAKLPGCAGTADFEGDHQTVPHGVYVAEVEIDPDTGAVRLDRFTAVDDIGVVLNPGLAYGQIVGGIVQAIGQALTEHTAYDPDSGQLLSGSFMDYCIPRADDLPMFDCIDVNKATGSNPLGMKGAGEIGTMGGLAPVICAICDALGHDRIEMPATPEAVWRALNEAP